MNAASEIGGYLELERYAGSLYHDDAVALNCCRGCLAYVAELRGFSRIWVPDFMCDCVPALFGREGVEVSNYRIGPDLLPVYDFSVGASDWMLLCDYYGQLRAEESSVLRCIVAGGLSLMRRRVSSVSPGRRPTPFIRAGSGSAFQMEASSRPRTAQSSTGVCHGTSRVTA